MIRDYREPTARRGVVGTGILLIVLVLSLTTYGAREARTPITADQAELMGRVEDFFLHNFRDVTARKSLGWGKVETDDQGQRSIRYEYEATIWDREKKRMSQVFTFKPDGSFKSVADIGGMPAPPYGTMTGRGFGGGFRSGGAAAAGGMSGGMSTGMADGFSGGSSGGMGGGGMAGGGFGGGNPADRSSGAHGAAGGGFGGGGFGGGGMMGGGSASGGGMSGASTPDDLEQADP